MTSRRTFIKTAGLFGGITAMPLLSDDFSLNKLSSAPDLQKASSDDELFALVRKQLLVPEKRIYLNTGSLGPCPVHIIDAMHALTRQLEMNPVRENWGPLGNQMELVRKKVADFIHAAVDEIVLTRNTTEGLSLIAQSLSIKEGDEIITTTLEHGGAEVGLEFLVKTKGAVLKKIELPLPVRSAEEVVSAVEKNITSRTKLILLSHVNTVTGMIMPFAEIARLSRPKGIFLLADGAQAPGTTPVDVKALGVDAYSASGHKWLMGPKETGFLYINKAVQESVKPAFIHSGNEAYTASSGTRNVATIIGLGMAIDFITSIGLEKIQQRTLQVRNYCLAELKKIKGLKVISPESRSLSTGIVSFSLNTVKNTDVFHQLNEQDIIVKLLTQHNAIRISCHLFVSKQDIDQFIKALKALL
jgi:selenocysteine lyase/cysteine desulfurase